MENLEIKNETIQEEAETTVATLSAAGVPTIKKVKAKARTIEELETISTRSMTEAEAKRYVEHLKAKNAELETRVANLDETCQSAFRKVREIEDNYGRMVGEANAKLQFIQQATSTFHSSIIFALKGGN